MSPSPSGADVLVVINHLEPSEVAPAQAMAWRRTMARLALPCLDDVPDAEKSGPAPEELAGGSGAGLERKDEPSHESF
jgi:hypothetical protein